MSRIFVQSSKNIKRTRFKQAPPHRVGASKVPRVHISYSPEISLTRDVRQFVELNPAVGRVVPAKIVDMIPPKLWVNIISGTKLFDHISREIFKDENAEKVWAVVEFGICEDIP